MGLLPERHVERPYPGTCRNGLQGKPVRSWRFALENFVQDLAQRAPPANAHSHFAWHHHTLQWQDRRLGRQTQEPLRQVGDFVLQRADGLYAYQLAVVVDDAHQGITHVVRGEDLTDNTPRQMLLQSALSYVHPLYLHTPLVLMPNGEKLSKQHGAPALDLHVPIAALNQAAQALGLRPVSPANTVSDALAQWVKMWQDQYN